jgi:hypothetical protein
MSVAKPIPVPTPETQPFWEGCRAGELRLQRCRACDHVQFPPRRYCSGCLSDDIAWERASGRGLVRSWTLVTLPNSAAFVADLPFVMALIGLEEGPTIMSGIKGCEPGDVHIGMLVEVEFETRSEEIHLPYFHPVAAV